jgi:hypothetical protein
MIRIRLSTLHAAAESRPPGYVDDVLQHADSISSDYVFLTPIAYRDLCLKYREPTAFDPAPQPTPDPPPLSATGPGTILLQLIERLGVSTSTGCPCRSKLQKMNDGGHDWCLENLAVIVSWLETEAATRGLPYTERFATLLVRRAVRRSRAAEVQLNG